MNATPAIVKAEYLKTGFEVQARRHRKGRRYSKIAPALIKKCEKSCRQSGSLMLIRIILLELPW